ncbi:MAG: cupin domain-containing protein [Bacteroidia bacterium]|nr:cupin domain-containing protein [Bacteroidia bacterium]
MLTAKDYIQQLELTAHVEGGYYKESFRSDLLLPSDALPERFTGDRVASTHIYFLLEFGQCSKLHRIASEEHWHFYAGNSLEIIELNTQNQLIIHKLGNRIEKGEKFHVVIQAGSWFGSRCTVPNGFSLVGCTVAPGFDFNDFEMGDRSELLVQFPDFQEFIMELT